MISASDFIKVAVEPDRLAVLGLLAVKARTVDDLASETGQDHRDVVEHLGVLVQAGVAVAEGTSYALSVASLRSLAQDVHQPTPPAHEITYGMTAGEQVILARFFEGTRLREIPTARGKRRVVLERIAADRPGIQTRSPLPRTRGQRSGRSLPPRLRIAATLSV